MFLYLNLIDTKSLVAYICYILESVSLFFSCLRSYQTIMVLKLKVQWIHSFVQ